MDALVLAARLLLAATLALAGTAKLASIEEAARGARDLGAPSSLARPLVLAVSLVEVAAASLLLPAATLRLGAALALALLVLFSAALASALARGRRVDCRCLGPLGGGGGGLALVRDGVLIAASSLALAGEARAIDASFALLGLAFLPGAVLLLRRRRALAFEAASPLRPGARLPSLQVSLGAGRYASLSQLLRGDTVFLLWRPGCLPCRGLYEQVRAWEREPPPGAPSLVVVSYGSAADAVDRFSSPVVFDESLEVAATLARLHAPAALRVDGSGRLASGLATSAEEVMALLRGRAEPGRGSGNGRR